MSDIMHTWGLATMCDAADDAHSPIDCVMPPYVSALTTFIKPCLFMDAQVPDMDVICWYCSELFTVC